MYDNFLSYFNLTEYYKGIDLDSLRAMQDEFEIRRFKKMFSFFPVDHDRIKTLEIGAGHGKFATFLIDKGIDYYGIEPNHPLACALLKRNIRVKECSVPPIPYPPDTFDVIVHSHVLEHIESSKLAYEFMQSCAETLKKGGRLIFRCPNILTWGMYFWDVDYTHCFPTSPVRVKQLIYDAGLELQHFEEISYFKPLKYGFYRYILPSRGPFYKLYPALALALGKIFKNNTELLFVCGK